MQKFWITFCSLYVVGEFILLVLGLDGFTLFLLGAMAFFPTLIFGIPVVYKNERSKPYLTVWIIGILFNLVLFMGGFL